MKHLVLAASLLLATAAQANFTICAPLPPSPGGGGGGGCLVSWSCPCPDPVTGQGACDYSPGNVKVCGTDLGGGNYDCSGEAQNPKLTSYSCGDLQLNGPCNRPDKPCLQGSFITSNPGGWNVNSAGQPSGPTPTCVGASANASCSKQQFCDPSVQCCKTVGDPIAAKDGLSIESVEDAKLDSILGPITLTRYFTQSPLAYAWHEPFIVSSAGIDGGNYPGFPFGATTVVNGSQQWRHNWQSFVKTHPTDADSAEPLHYDVLEPGGALVQFSSCSPLPCFGASYSNTLGTRQQLYIEANRFTLLRGPEGRLVYESALGDRMFLTRWEDAQYPASGEQPRTRAAVTYATPAGCPGVTATVPFVASVQTLEGARFEFDYAPMVSLGISQCILSRVRVARGATSEAVVAYSYSIPGFISEAKRGVDGGLGKLGYDFQSSSWTVTQNNFTTTQHLYTPTLKELGQGGVEMHRFASEDAGVRNWSAFLPMLGTSSRQQVVSNIFYPPTSFVLSPAPIQITQGCENWDCSGTWTKYMNYTAVGAVDQLLASASDTRGNYRVNSWDAGTISLPPGFISPVELRQVAEGAVDSSGTSPLQTTTYKYTYGSLGQTPRAYEQYVSEENQASVLQSGQLAKTVTTRDPATNRVTATFRTGWTRAYNETSGVWSTASRTVGTFYFTARKCSDNVADTFGRTLEVHGPCVVASTAATDCASGSAVPITQYAYFPASPPSALDAHRLQSEKKWVSATNPAACAGTSLTTSYSNYDVYGNPGTVTDPNGVATTLTYASGRPASSTINGNTTTYFWDNNTLAAIEHPEGNFDVYCHRQVALGSACSTAAAWTPQLQWHVKAPNLDGTGYTEGTASFYWPDGRLAREEVWDGLRAEKRRETAYEENSRGQRLRTTVGVGASAYYVLRRYDADGLLTGGADGQYSASCGLQASAAGSGSNTCSNIQNDRMGRIASMDVVGAVSGQTGRTCLTYDAQGNVATVRTGCPSDSNSYPGPSCSACTTPVSTYQSDDFGNVVGATLPHLASGAGTISTTFNALGQPLLRQTPAMVPERARTKYTYDGLGRELTVVHAWSLPSASSQTLSSSLYDNAATLNANCPQPSNNLGRLLNRTDTFGKTWYRFSPEGRLTGEIRLRSGTTCASQLPRNVPHTFYTYSANGNLTSIQYPYGRTVTYVIGTAGAKTTDRPSSVTVTKWNGTTWSPWTALSNIVYEPFGGVRAYQMGTTPTSNVEYLAGATGYSDSNTCPMAKPTTNDYSGRRRLLNASFGSLSVGAGAGDIFQEFRAYTGTNPSTLTTCWGSGSAKQWVPKFAPYQQLTNTIYGQYDVRGNRKVMNAMNSDFALDYSYYSDAGVDQLVEVQRAGVPSVKYLYDADGRTTNIRSVNDSTGTPGMEEIWAPSSDGNVPQGGLESVYKTVSIAGAVYSYYYDANNHRRLKQYPTGASDEFFYDTGNRLLVDRGNAAVSSPGWLTTDEYVWLDEKPVVVMRGRLNTTTDVRSADTTAACGRNGEAQACGAYFILTDELPKPLALLDDTGKHARRLNWDGFGMTNRLELRSGAQSQHPYPANDYESLYGAYPTLTAGVSTALRFEVEVLDTEGSASAPVDFLELRQSYVAQSQTGGAHRGRVYTPWLVADGGYVQLAFLSGPRSCPPEGCLADGGLPDGGSYPYYGALVAAIETAERQGGAKAFDIPMRFPGQYYDAESQKHENHNRYFNPLTGTYLSPEPLLQDPSYVRLMAQGGMSVPTYAYALNNPIRYVDRNGLCVSGAGVDTALCLLYAGEALEAVALAFGYGAAAGMGAGAIHNNNSPGMPAGMSSGAQGGSGSTGPLDPPSGAAIGAGLVCMAAATSQHCGAELNAHWLFALQQMGLQCGHMRPCSRRLASTKVFCDHLSECGGAGAPGYSEIWHWYCD